MTELGRRERKKLATRQALIDAAVDLFTERGFDGTTVAQIAERADLSARTFFLHFATKEDVLMGGSIDRVDLVLGVLHAAQPGERAVDVLARALHSMIDDFPPREAELTWLRLRLGAVNPTFQAGVFRRRHEAEVEYTRALLERFGDEFDELGAAATVSAAMGATYAAAVTAIRRNDAPEGVRAAMHRAVDIALHGTGTLPAR
ncbi:TetR/AcrR family transcriptional regulator [Pseudonocardia sp. HH130630-07]|uniref:TetR/AcrR family transcriptional regulator n=1 Tax=Pseudonocardia sp. HH130630-07 TaxID=1690815 RepID=UPI000814FCF8|nr:TetR family transcriptional regulator [Pseudonocardia sp. HH130630-07]ANY05827.1 hypothetical protein AFB00_05400 [Pseudonocardia sp. HH130630-07]